MHCTEILIKKNDLYGKPDIIRIVKSRRLRWAGHVKRMGNERDYITGSYMIFMGSRI